MMLMDVVDPYNPSVPSIIFRNHDVLRHNLPFRSVGELGVDPGHSEIRSVCSVLVVEPLLGEFFS